MKLGCHRPLTAVMTGDVRGWLGRPLTPAGYNITMGNFITGKQPKLRHSGTKGEVGCLLPCARCLLLLLQHSPCVP